MGLLDPYRDIGSDKIWRDAALLQCEVFETLSAELGLVPKLESHTSKSIRLPVLTFRSRATNGRAESSVTVLDNFFELGLHYVGPSVKLTYEECGYKKMTREEYLYLIGQTVDQTWRHWSPEELLDPRITRVPTPDGGWSERRPELKQLWNDRMTSAAWTRELQGYPVVGDVAAVLAGTGHLWRATPTMLNYEGPYVPKPHGNVRQRFSLRFPCLRQEDLGVRVQLIKKLLAL